ncbi:toll/interleukin-1 receptor domain-containing protein [Streptomyces sp. NBC_01352]|uniref:toll/interleukin-1 receptor domain-containing protein n=1 Tax=Streptomyces sp. NBC_01352 TaxID=2903834 RepID=UPI002E346732|nr:toll/interleukin-1 receptor domain-containing protein [Streptomyces sp. NBC_01352]
MARPRVFLSHSSQCTAETGCECLAYLCALEEHLVGLGCEPVIDKGVLTGGDNWREKLLLEIKRCQGMIILLSPHALNSYYVHMEATAALTQQAGDKDGFLILPLMLPGVDLDRLRGSPLSQLKLDEYDMANWKGNAAIANPPAKIGDSFRAVLARWGELPHPQLTKFIAGRIADLDESVLEDSARILGVTLLAYARDTSRYYVAQGLLRERPVRDVGDRCDLRSALKLILPQVRLPEHRREIVDVAVPFARVPKKAAEQLRGVGQASSGRMALLRSELAETPGLYVRKASEAPEPWTLCKAVPRQDGADFIEGVVEEIRALLIAELAFGLPCDDDKLRQLLVRHEEEFGPVTIVLHLLPDAALTSRLLVDFPRLLFIFAHQEADTVGESGGMISLESLTPGQEQDMVFTHLKFSGHPLP